MAFPLVESITQSILDSATTSNLVANPATVAVDDLLIYYFTNDGNATVTTPTGLTLRSSTAHTTVRHSVYVKKAVGDEGGTNVDFVTSAIEKVTAQVYRILAAQWSKTLSEVEVGTAATGDSTSPDPPSLTPAGGAKDYLWIASQGNDDTDATTGYPTNYTNGTNTVGSGGGFASTATARRELNATTEDPGTFTLAAAEGWVAQLTVVPPSGAAPVAISLTPVAMSLGVQSISPTLAPLAVALTPAQLSLAVQSLTPTLAPLSISLTAVNLTLSPQALVLALGALATALTPAQMSLAAQILKIKPVEITLIPVEFSLDVIRAFLPIPDVLAVSDFRYKYIRRQNRGGSRRPPSYR